MHGLVTLLDAEHDRRVKDLWRELAQECALRHVAEAVPFPHFSWLVSEAYDAGKVTAALQRVTAGARPFAVRTAGLGIFSGPHTVLYIAVVRSPELTGLHRLIWSEMQGAHEGALDYYRPERWMPHITLAEGDVDPERMACAARLLADREFAWDLRVDNLVMVHDTGLGAETSVQPTHELRWEARIAEPPGGV